MQDGFRRKIDYLRISVTDRCNFRCLYCMPPEGVRQFSHRDILTYEEILYIVDVLSHYCGITKIRLTGGEPLVRKGLTRLIHGIAQLGTIEDLSMTTNGSLLAEHAPELKQSGLNRVNVSIDTLDAARFSQITRGGDLAETLRGIAHALQAGLLPVKINVVLTAALSVQDLEQFAAMVYDQPLIVRFIEYMPVGGNEMAAGMTSGQVKQLLADMGKGSMQPVGARITGCGPARYYTLAGARGAFGFITPVSDHFCPACNRMRLTADGKLKPCLLADQEIDVKNALRSGADRGVMAGLFLEAVRRKPAGHRLNADDHAQFSRSMSQIGG